MKNLNYSTQIIVSQSAKQVFEAINDVRKWWSEEIEGPTNVEGEEWRYHYKDIHLCTMKVLELVPNKKVVWLVTNNYFSFIPDQSEWVGNHIIFEIEEKDNMTTLTFTQEGLIPDYECDNVCKDGWDNYIQKSLYNLITTGQGTPNPREGIGFNQVLAEKWGIN